MPARSTGRCSRSIAQRWRTTAAKAVWLLWLYHGLIAVHADLCPQLDSTPSFCQTLPKVCVDQNVYVMYENQHNPRHELFSQLPHIRLDNISTDYFGYGDLWGTKFTHPLQLIRPATGGEETRELQHPQFSRCSVPMVLYINHLYKYSHFLVNTVATLHILQQSQSLDKRLNLVIDTMGMQLEPFHRFLLAPFSSYEVTTFSYMSSRQPLEKPEPFNPDGQHIRCFWQLLACQMGVAGQLLPVGMQQPLWSTGQAILEHYKLKLPAIDPEFAQSSKMRVLIAARPRNSKLRTLLNQEQVWSWCSKFQPPRGVMDWNGTACLLHEFGRDLLSDVAYASQADVLLGVHADSLFNAFTMRKQSSLVEIRPYGYNTSRHSRLRDMTASDDDSIFWWGVDIVNHAHSMAGALEQQQRGTAHTWPRERHTFIRLMALQYVFERIALTRTDISRYKRFRDKGEHHINDLLQRVGNATQRHRRLLLRQQQPLGQQLQPLEQQQGQWQPGQPGRRRRRTEEQQQQQQRQPQQGEMWRRWKQWLMQAMFAV